jgi:hypothetical protein
MLRPKSIGIKNAENSAFGNAENNLSINDLAYPIGSEVSDANAVLRKHHVAIVHAGTLMLTFQSEIGGYRMPLN